GSAGQDPPGMERQPELHHQQHRHQDDGHDNRRRQHLTPVTAAAPPHPDRPACVEGGIQGEGMALALPVILAAMTPPAGMAAAANNTIRSVWEVISPRSS